MEERFNAPASDILSAIEHGFRAQVDVKGKLAEYYLFRELEALRSGGLLQDIEWIDADGKADFLVEWSGRKLRIECKNVRSAKLVRSPGWFRVELQKTRNSKDGTPTRRYGTDEFDVLSVCLFNQTREWRYVHIATQHLLRDTKLPNHLVIMQKVPEQAVDRWRSSLKDALLDALDGKLRG